MQEVGNLSIDDNSKESKLDDTLLAVEGSGDPFGDATAFLERKGFADGEQARITGNTGEVGDVDVIFMTDAERLPAAIVEAFVTTTVIEAIIPVKRKIRTRPKPSTPVTPPKKAMAAAAAKPTVKKKAKAKPAAKKAVKKAAKKVAKKALKKPAKKAVKKAGAKKKPAKKGRGKRG
jgi:hypothetical protein